MSQEIGLTKHNEFGRIAVSLAHHIGAYAHVHACVTFPGVRNHQLITTHLKKKKNHTYHYIIVQPNLILKNDFSVFSSVKVHSCNVFLFKKFPS